LCDVAESGLVGLMFAHCVSDETQRGNDVENIFIINVDVKKHNQFLTLSNIQSRLAVLGHNQSDWCTFIRKSRFCCLDFGCAIWIATNVRVEKIGDISHLTKSKYSCKKMIFTSLGEVRSISPERLQNARGKRRSGSIDYVSARTFSACYCRSFDQKGVLTMY
jgi:hypothetical protein